MEDRTGNAEAVTQFSIAPLKIRIRTWKDQGGRGRLTYIEVTSHQGIKLGQWVFNIEDLLIYGESFCHDIEGKFSQRDKIRGGCVKRLG